MKVRKKNNKVAKYTEFTVFILGTFLVIPYEKVEYMSVKLENIFNAKDLTISDIEYLLNEADVERCEAIKYHSKIIAKKVSPNYHNSEKNVKISNHCNANCLFCESHKENKIERFRLNREEIIDKSVEFYKSGCKSIFIHSSYDTFYDTDRIAYIIYSIKKRANIKITLSLGLREINEYKKWKIAGADSYFLSFVTSNSKLYNACNTWGTLENRTKHIEELKNLGYDVGSGSVLGLPNQTLENIAEDILLSRNLNVDYINFCKYENSTNTNNNQLTNKSVDVAQIVIPKVKVGIKFFI